MGQNSNSLSGKTVLIDSMYFIRVFSCFEEFNINLDILGWAYEAEHIKKVETVHKQ